jgi:hypothetical protein
MPLQKLQFRPGVNREGTTLSNEGGWYDCDKIRFRSGYPEKIGGWQTDGGVIATTAPTGTFASGGTSTSATVPSGTGAYWGITRSMWNWINLIGYNLLSLGTNLKFYIQNSSGGAFNDVTPIRSTTAAGDVTFSAVSGSPTITVTDTANGVQVGDFVTFSGAVTLGGNITATVLNREYQVVTVPSITTYTITASVNANGSDSGNGGSATVGNYQLTTANTTFTFGTGYGAGGYGGSLGPSYATTINGGTAVTDSSTTPITVVSTAGFAASGTIWIGTEGITYTAITGTTFQGTITRGAGGLTAPPPNSSTPAAHANGSAVYQYPSTATGYGSAATTGVGIQLRLWSQSNYGEDLVFNPRGAAMYYWANNASANVYDRGQIVAAGVGVVNKYGTFTPDATCPSLVNFVLVSDSSRFTFAFGCNDPTGVYASTALDPLQVRWSDQNTLVTWTPSITNQAGGIRLSHGSAIVTAIQARQEVLVLTDSAIYSFQYLGAPYVWSTQLLADNISIVGPNAIATANNVTYWMGTDKFYTYSGRVETLPCALRQYIYTNINVQEAYQFFSGTNEGYNEIWWCYVSITGTNPDGNNSAYTAANPNKVVDRYVIYNHLERTWYYGTFNGVGNSTYGTVRPRTAWLDSPLRAEPMAATGYLSGAYTNGGLVYQETGVDNNETGTPVAIDAYVQSSDFDIGDGHNFGFVWRLIPDVTFDGSTSAAPSVNFTVRPRQNPGANYGDSDNPAVTSAQSYASTTAYNVQQFTQQIFVRIRGRQMAFKLESNTLGTQWQLGAPRIDVRADGRR